MAHTIRFSVHRNPSAGSDGQSTYHVRQDHYDTATVQDLLADVRYRSVMRPEQMEMALHVLEGEIAHFLLGNRRLHIEGLGTFFLRLGFTPQVDESGEAHQAHFTDPYQITGHDVQIDSIGFVPDKTFLQHLSTEVGTGFENITGRGHVGHSAAYTEEAFMQRLDTYLQEHGFLTRRALIDDFGLTDYMARKWLTRLTAQPNPCLRKQKMGTGYTYWPV